MMSGTLVSGTIPFPSIPTSGTMSVLGSRPSPDPASAMTGIMHPGVVPAAASEVDLEATLERVTALENQVCSLEAKFMELLVKLDEVSSCVSTSSTPRRQAAAGASPTTSNATFEDLQVQHLADAPSPSPLLPPVNVTAAVRLATREWVEGPRVSALLPDTSSPMDISTQESVEGSKTLGHSVGHLEGYTPVNCSCSVRDFGPVLAMAAGAEESGFSDRALASRGNLF